MKKSMVMVIVLALVSAVFFALPRSASADVDVLAARIDRIGMYFPNDTRGAMVQLTDTSSTPKWTGSRQFFLSQASCGKEGLAIMLTAFSMDKTVFVRVAGTGEALSLITAVYVNK